MAKIKFGMMMTDARGKLGGQVFSKNRSGAYVRTKVTPSNPQTSYQQLNRAFLGNLSSSWSGLTESQRNAWNSQVENWQKTNVFGDLTKPTGKNLFTSLNKVLLQHFPEADLMANPPSKVEFLPFTIVTFIASVGTGIIVTLPAPLDSTQQYRVRMTPLLSAGTTYIKNQLRTVGETFAPAVNGQIVLSNEWSDRFGTIIAGNIIGVEITPIAQNGQLGVPQTAITLL